MRGSPSVAESASPKSSEIPSTPSRPSLTVENDTSNFSQPLTLQTNASAYGLGAVLTQQLDQEEQVIAYTSRTLNPAEKNYSATELECLAVVWRIRRMRDYLRVVRALYRLMPNLRGPDERRRRLFANVIMSVVLYGAPVWGDRIVKKSCTVPALHRLHRTIAQRVISAYRTVSSNAASLLARLPPIKLLAIVRKRTFEKTKELRDNGNLDPISRREIKETEFANMCNEWRTLLEKPNTPGEFTKLIIVPRLENWLNRDTINGMTFHLTQVFTGHGCFSKFLHMIGKKTDPTCFACGMDDTDDVYHTLRECPMWDTQRLTMKEKLNLPRDFTLGDVVDIIVASREAWLAFSAFVEGIMKEKEDVERRIERARLSSSASSTSPQRRTRKDLKPTIRIRTR
ncbi:reverse transcriptase [Lasius niger]|uniref:Reverse transcriptase n=1 Tax=Lasius niger TaxID=67767 RepID=A0A0J7MX22_LASNI|nr:reverse transcriptase [Lasius niger]